MDEARRGGGMIADLKTHPKGLAVLSATELAERFSYYGMVTLLVLYMVDQLLLPEHAARVIGLAPLRALFEWRGPLSDQAFASLLYGWYAGLVYFTPLIGGWIADRFLGPRRTVTLGAVLMAAGHFAMSFDQTFLIALGLLVAGSGCLKGNITAQVGPLYAPQDESRRARGFTIFSTGINVGATLGPLVTGALAQAYGWHAGFACAGVLMLVSLAIYLRGQRHLRGTDRPVRAAGEAAAEVAPLTRDERRRVAGLVWLILCNVPIIACYYQITNVGLVWIDERVDLSTPLGRVPTPWFGALDSFVSILVAAPLLALWAAQSRAGREGDSLSKILTGAALNAVATLILVAGIALDGEGRLSMAWPIMAWTLMGTAFMFYWPITLGMVAAHAPTRVRSTLMGGAFLSIFAGNVFLGWVGTFYETLGETRFWTMNAGIGAVALAMLLPALRPLRAIFAVR